MNSPFADSDQHEGKAHGHEQKRKGARIQKRLLQSILSKNKRAPSLESLRSALPALFRLPDWRVCLFRSEAVAWAPPWRGT